MIGMCGISEREKQKRVYFYPSFAATFSFLTKGDYFCAGA
jgi:hypothetical protein